MAATVSPLPVAPNAALVARNLIARAGTADPVAIAEHVGLEVLQVEPAYTLHAPGALHRGTTILVSTDTAEDQIDRVVGRLLAAAVVDRWAIATADRFAFEREVAAEIARAAQKGAA